jgi:4-diphosphocytidyl-2-C-methyl-D-erythritol kinase
MSLTASMRFVKFLGLNIVDVSSLDAAWIAKDDLLEYWSPALGMQIGHRDALIEVRAPAKVNLFLEVLRRREDGFHEIETLMVPVSLADTLRCAARQDGQLCVTCRWTRGLRAICAAGSSCQIWTKLPEGGDNLVFRALQQLRQAAGGSQGLDVEILKRIPSSAGLGGASSDAAAALVAANRLWGLDWPLDRLGAIASAVGSDVPFFLQGGAAICRGRGEKIEAVEGFRGWWLVIVRPPEGLATGAIYRECVPAECVAASPESGDSRAWSPGHSGSLARGPRSAAELCAAAARGDLTEVARRLFNRLQSVAEQKSAWIGRLRAAFGRTDCVGHQMSGSGSSYFGICRHAGHARRVAGRLRSADLGAVFVTATRGIGLSRGRTSEQGHRQSR